MLNKSVAFEVGTYTIYTVYNLECIVLEQPKNNGLH